MSYLVQLNRFACNSYKKNLFKYHLRINRKVFPRDSSLPSFGSHLILSEADITAPPPLVNEHDERIDVGATTLAAYDHSRLDDRDGGEISEGMQMQAQWETCLVQQVGRVRHGVQCESHNFRRTVGHLVSVLVAEVRLRCFQSFSGDQFPLLKRQRDKSEWYQQLCFISQIIYTLIEESD